MEVSPENVERTGNKESIVERKLRLLENPSSIVIAPKTREGHILVKILFGFDRGVGRLRMKAGTYIKIEHAMGCLRQAGAIISRFNELTSLLGGDGRGGWGLSLYTEDPSTRVALAKRLTTYVILPRTNEGKEVANLIKKFDPALLQFRNTCTDFSKSEEVFGKLIDLIGDFSLLTDQISSLAGTSYDPPRDLAVLLRDRNGGPSDREIPGPEPEQKAVRSKKSGGAL